MNRTTTPHSGKVRRRMAAAVIGITAATAALGDTTPAQASCRIGPTSEQIELGHVVDRTPAGWPATEVMRRQLDELLGDDVDCDRRVRLVDRTPAGWPATEVMRREIDGWAHVPSMGTAPSGTTRTVDSLRARTDLVVFAHEVDPDPMPPPRPDRNPIMNTIPPTTRAPVGEHPTPLDGASGTHIVTEVAP